MSKLDPPPEPAMPAAVLSLADAEVLRKGLRGVQSIEVRQFGGPPSASEEIAVFLAQQGIAATTSRIKLMAPPPLRRFVFRYAGTSAVLTFAPDLDS